MTALRIFWTGFVLHLKNLSASPFMVMTAALWPLVYATLAFLMFRATDHAPSLLYAALGAAVMGIWSTTATSAGGAIQQLRNWKVLELLVGATLAVDPRSGADHRGDRRDRRLLDRHHASVLLIFCGVNIPLDKLPHWMHLTAEGLPMTHAIAAARDVAAGASLGSVGTPILVEAALGTSYLLAGLVLLRVLEDQGRRSGSLERA